MTGTVTLYRPVGSAELALLAVSQWKRFPGRLAGLPYMPPGGEAEACAFVRDWCATHDDDSCGFIVRFEAKADAGDTGDVRILNAAIVGPIWLIAEYGCK